MGTTPTFLDFIEMKIIYGKTPSFEENKLILQLAYDCGVSKDTAKLLFFRNINTPEKVNKFLNPTKKGFHDPFLLSDMNQVVERITYARDHGEKVLIFGDYDADGVCATTVLYNALKIFGIEALKVIPERDDGYGLNLEIVSQINEITPLNLIITVDCGISDCEKISELKARGIDVIVTDHHEPPETLPDCLKINPKIIGQAYPFDGLCGAGVAYKLGYALIGEKANGLLDYVALATVADSMDLVDENRDIVAEGLKLFNSKYIREEFKYLVGENVKQITSQTLAYTIAPRINAGGRMGDAASSLNLFLSSNSEDKFNLAVKLNEYNIARQVECDEIYKLAKEKIKAEGAIYDDIILVSDERWSTGFVGIVASRLVEEFARPVIVFAGYGDLLKGSARSVEGLNIFDALNSVKDLLVCFGGHSQAAGVTVEKSNFALLKTALNSYVKARHGKLDVEKKIFVEWEVDGEFSIRFAREIERFEPFGVGNKKPLFSVRVDGIKSNPLKQGSPHYTFKTSAMEMLDFNGESHVSLLGLPVEKQLIFEANLSVYNKREYLKGYVKGLVADYSDLSGLKYRIFENELKKLKNDFSVILNDATANDLTNGGYCTLYAVSDAENLKKYPSLNLPVSVFAPESKDLCDCIVVSPSFLPDGYSKVVYLDKPLAPIGKVESVCFNGVSGYKFIEKLNTDRAFFAEIFTHLRFQCGKEFLSSAWSYEKYGFEIDGYNFIFATEVFLELGIFYIKDGILLQDLKVKNPLTNSKIYNKICQMLIG